MTSIPHSFLLMSLMFAVFVSLEQPSAGLPACNGCCIKGNYLEIDDPRRSIKNVWKPGQQAVCDRTLLWGWYRFTSYAGGQMPTQMVPKNHCGTMAPIWLRGNHPSVNDGTVTRQACVNMMDLNNGCVHSFDIYIRNCGNYYVYYLAPTYGCSIAYCAGDKMTCPSGKVGNYPKCYDLPTQFPSDYLGDPTITFKDDNKEDKEVIAVTLRCKVNLLSGVENWKNVTYQLQWFSEGKELSADQFCQPSPEETENSVPCPGRQELVSHLHGGKYTVGQRITCNVTAKFTTSPNNTWSFPKHVKHPFFAGIQVYPTALTLVQCSTVTKTLTITPTIPVRGDPLEITFWVPSGIMVADKQCKFLLTGTEPVIVHVVANCTTLGGTGGQRIITPKISSTHSGFWNMFATGLPTIWVTVIEKADEIHKCKALGDPHYITLDKIGNGRWFDFMGQGDFIFYRNKERNFEIQTRQWTCSSTNSVTCNCGAVLRDHNDVIEFSCCNPKLYHDTTTPLRVKQRSKKCLSAGISITQAINGFNSKYEVLFATGVKVELQRNYWGIDVTLYTPRAKNRADEEGLCLYDGPNDKTPVDTFGYKQRLNPGQSLFDTLPQQIEVLADSFEESCSCDTLENTKPHCKIGIPVFMPNAMDQKSSRITICDRIGSRSIGHSDDLTDDDFEQFVAQNEIHERKAHHRFKRAPSPVSKKNATQYCKDRVADTDIGKLCAKLGTNVQSLVNTCSADIEYTGDFSYAIGAVALLMSECGDVAARNETFATNDDGDGKAPTPSVRETVSKLLCPNDCTFNGKCLDGSCVCNKDFTAQDCSVSIYQSPEISKLQGNGLCDRRKRPCRKVTVMGNGFLDSENVTCHVEEFKVVNGSWTPNKTELKFPGIMTDLVLVDCYLPESPVMESPYDGNREGTPAAGLMISVSNNGVHESKNKLKFISYDSTCMECNISTGCFFKNNSCLINGYCFAFNEANPNDWCYQCLPDVDINSWTKRQVNLAPRITSGTQYFALYKETLELTIEASDPENMPVTVSLLDGRSKEAVIQDNVLLWNVTANTTTSFHLKATDACNASSTLAINVSLVVCQCTNGGVCAPHPQKPRGSGFYECHCPPGLTGVKCETDVDECQGYPCSRGRCVDMLNNYSCICDPGFVGKNCDRDYDDCQSSPCAHGNCTDYVSGYDCNCAAGYTGDQCDIDIDECQSSPCNNGTCTDIINGFKCSCPAGITGNTCEVVLVSCGNVSCYSGVSCTNTTGNLRCGACPSGMTGDGISCFDVDDCVNRSCINGGSCVDGINNYTCVCQAGFIGDHCEVDIDDCVNHTCYNGATCVDGVNKYSCVCQAGFTGKHCQIDLDDCVNHTCLNGASCVDHVNDYSCVCQAGFTGGHCQIDINDCLNRSCQNGGLCVDGVNNYTCICRPGFTGDHCTVDIDDCVNHTCNNGATCVDGVNNYSCVCQAGFTGLHCENDVDDCVNRSCENGGSCVDRVNNHICVCPAGFTGDHCQSNIDDCNGVICENGGTCIDEVKDFMCACKEGFTGIKCEEVLDETVKPSTDESTTSIKPTFGGDSSEKLSKEIVMEIRINMEWTEDFLDKKSDAFKNISSILKREILKSYSGKRDLEEINILSFSFGSIVAEIELIFKTAVDERYALEPLKQEIADGKLGSLDVQPDSLILKPKTTDNPPKESSINISMVVGISCGVFALVAVIAVLVWCTRQTRCTRTGPDLSGMPNEVACPDVQKYEMQARARAEKRIPVQEKGIWNSGME